MCTKFIVTDTPGYPKILTVRYCHVVPAYPTPDMPV